MLHFVATTQLRLSIGLLKRVPKSQSIVSNNYVPSHTALQRALTISLVSVVTLFLNSYCLSCLKSPDNSETLDDFQTDPPLLWKKSKKENQNLLDHIIKLMTGSTAVSFSIFSDIRLTSTLKQYTIYLLHRTSQSISRKPSFSMNTFEQSGHFQSH